MTIDIRSDALLRIRPSATIAMTRKAQLLRASGRTGIIALSSGEPDFPTAENVRAAAVAAIERGESKYPPVAGIAPLKQAIRQKFKSENSLDYEDNEVIVSSGGKQVIANALLATLNPGDEVIIPAPYWGTYEQLVLLCGAKPVLVSARAEDDFCLRPETLSAAFTTKTKWVVLNNPCNPTGATYDAQALKALTDVLVANPDVWLLSDDIYEHIIYDERTFCTAAEIEPRLKDRALTVNGVSKAYAMTGWRIGYAGGPANLIKAMESLQSQLSHGASQVSQWAAVEALSGPQTFVATARDAFMRRRNRMCERLAAIDGIDCPMPGGAFYLYPSCAELLGRRTAAGTTIESDEDFCLALLEEAGVAVVPGIAFGHGGHFRVSYAASDESLSTAAERIAQFCASLQIQY